MSDKVKLNSYERTLLINAAKRTEAIFKLFGWTWKPRGRRIPVTWRRAYKVMKENFLIIKREAQEVKTYDSFILGGGGTGRIWVKAVWEHDDVEPTLTDVEIMIHIANIDMEYQGMFDTWRKHRDFQESAYGLKRAQAILEGVK